MGHFLTLNCDKDQFVHLLVDADITPANAKKCADAFAQKAAIFCQAPGTTAPASTKERGPGQSVSYGQGLTLVHVRRLELNLSNSRTHS